VRRIITYLGIAVLGVVGAVFFLHLGDSSAGGSWLVSKQAGNAAGESFPPSQETTYRMGLYLDTASLGIYGKSVIETRNNLSHPLEDLYFTVYPNAFQTREHTPAPISAYRGGFDPGWLQVTEVRVNGRPAEFTMQDISLRVLLAEDVLPGQNLSITMSWKGKIPRAAYRYGAQDGVIMLGNFYPALNVRQGDKWLLAANTAFGDPFCWPCADFQVKINVPSEYQVISTGTTLSREAEASGRDTVLIEAPRARDFALVACWQHLELSAELMGVTVKCHVLPTDQATGRQVLARATKVLKYFACTFGSYPYPEIDIVQVPMEGFQGMEYSGLVFLRDEVWHPSYGDERRDFLVAHELAHQWWFGLVGNDQLREPWLDEGLANWSARRYLKEMEGKEYPARYDVHHNTNLARELGQMGSRHEYLGTAYNDGEAFWLALEGELGEAKVTQILRSYLASYRYRIASARDLRDIIEKEACRDMSPFFEKWFSD